MVGTAQVVAPSTEPADLEALAMAARDGDMVATEWLWDVARSRLTRVALALGVPPDDVPDLVQEALVSGWRNLARFNPSRGSFIGWMTPGLIGRARNRVRAGGRQHRFLEQAKRIFPRLASKNDEPHQAVEARLTLHRLLRALTRRQREVVALYDLDGLSARETGRILGMSEPGVRSLARDARRRLKDEARRLARRSPEETS